MNSELKHQEATIEIMAKTALCLLATGLIVVAFAVFHESGEEAGLRPQSDQSARIHVETAIDPAAALSDSIGPEEQSVDPLLEPSEQAAVQTIGRKCSEYY
ncbi:MAG TPA: hypothetical protein VJA26_05065 [Gammaproteobacteria bacterium]|nr:hypothetical protein [Gammaproteobacteria bacterium]